MEFFAAGAEHRERAFICSNRVGKSSAASFEVTLHLTGLYPAWWKGRRFDHPVRVWACGDTSTTVRDIIQASLLRPVHAPDTGFVPAHVITNWREAHR